MKQNKQTITTIPAGKHHSSKHKKKPQLGQGEEDENLNFSEFEDQMDLPVNMRRQNKSIIDTTNRQMIVRQ